MGNVIVTGAAGVIGKAICERVLAEGGRVLAVDLDPAAGEQLLADLGAGDRAVFHAADVTDEAAVKGYVDAAVAAFGAIDGFANNAGIEGVVAPITAYPTDVFEKVLKVNVTGVFLGLKYVMAAMAASGTGTGSIVNMASVAGLQGSAGVSAYIASKHAVIGITRTAALEGAGLGIRVNAVCPSPVESRMMNSLEDGFASMAGLADRNAAVEMVRASIPGGRYARPAEVASVVAWLLSDASSFVSGAAVPVDHAMTV